MDMKEDIGPWEDIKCLSHYAITIDTTYAQAAKKERGHQPSIWRDATKGTC